MSKIGEYLWWLLPAFLKRKGQNDPQGSTTWNLIMIQGESLDQSKVEVLAMRDQHAVETAEAEHLDMLGDERETKRFSGENDDDYRARIFIAAERKQKVGTKPHMETMVYDLGFGVEVTEVWTFDHRYWAEFIVHIWDDGRTITVTQEEFLRGAVYRIDLPLQTFDAWDFSLEAGLTFPERIQAIRATGEHLMDSANRLDGWGLP